MRRLPTLLLLFLLIPAAACSILQVRPQPAGSPQATARLLRTAAASRTAAPPPSPSPSPSPLSPTFTPTPTARPTASPRHLRVFEELWQVVHEDYLYPDFNGVDWDAIHKEFRATVAAGMSDEQFYQAMDEMIYRLGDDHSVFLSPEMALEEDAQYSGSFDYVGIGVLNTIVPERGRLTIVLVYPDSPADRAGLKAHDSILEVDGLPVLDEDGYRRDLLRGPEGSASVLTVQSPDEPPRRVEVVRERISGEMPVPYEVLENGGGRIGYIFLPTFNEITVGHKVGEALHAMTASEPLDGIILDNRQNDGGTSTQLSSALAYFTSGVMGRFVNRQETETLRVLGVDIGGSQSLPLVVLVGKNTISFGEIFAGILQDLGRAYLIGEQTEGNVEILWVYDFADRSRAWIAHDTFQPLNNPEANWETGGVVPDREVSGEWDEFTLETDPGIAAALEYFATLP